MKKEAPIGEILQVRIGHVIPTPHNPRVIVENSEASRELLAGEQGSRAAHPAAKRPRRAPTRAKKSRRSKPAAQDKPIWAGRKPGTFRRVIQNRNGTFRIMINRDNDKYGKSGFPSAIDAAIAAHRYLGNRQAVQELTDLKEQQAIEPDVTRAIKNRRQALGLDQSRYKCSECGYSAGTNHR